jgi:hypothetical protein
MAKSNPWMVHLRAFWAKNKGKMSYSAAMKAAKGSYKKVGAAGKKKKPKK